MVRVGNKNVIFTKIVMVESFFCLQYHLYIDVKGGIIMDNKNKVPEYLYHYTNIESLAMILKNKSIRFNSLCNLDDKLEDKINDLTTFGRFVFISSWTSIDKEVIPMWNMYTDMKAGVRIKVKKNPFLTYFSKENVKGSTKFTANLFDGGTFEFDFTDLIISPSEFLNTTNYSLVSPNGNTILHEVIYTEDKDLLIPHIYKSDFSHENIETMKLGKYKRTCWDFQKEWRYILYFSPISFKEMSELKSNSVEEIIKRSADPLYCLPFSGYPLEINQDAFNDMSITMSPKLSDGNKEILYLLKDKYNPNMEIYESDLCDTVK